MAASLTRSSMDIDGLHTEWLEIGTGPLAICVHGFPDSAYTWRHLLPELADAGFRAVAPWTRGYFPTGVAPDGYYEVGVRAQDMCRLHEALGGDGDAVIIGHDFGAGTATVAAVREPHRWSKLVAMSVPPGNRMTQALLQYEQLRRSSYMFFFQHELSEVVLPNDDWAFIRGLWADWSPGLSADDDIEQFIESVRPDGHLVAALSYYRANFQAGHQSPDHAEWSAARPTIPDQPMLYLHGRNDGCIGVETADNVIDDLAPGSHAVVFDDLGHFLQLEDPALVNSTIIDFLSGGGQVANR